MLHLPTPCLSGLFVRLTPESCTERLLLIRPSPATEAGARRPRRKAQTACLMPSWGFEPQSHVLKSVVLTWISIHGFCNVKSAQNKQSHQVAPCPDGLSGWCLSACPAEEPCWPPLSVFLFASHSANRWWFSADLHIWYTFNWTPAGVETLLLPWVCYGSLLKGTGWQLFILHYLYICIIFCPYSDKRYVAHKV